MKNTRFLTSAISVLALCASAGFASAHSSLEQSEAKAGGFYKAVVRIPQGCEGKATTAVKIELPEGFVSAQPQPKAGWKVETAKGDYAQSYKIHGKDVTSGVKQVTWSEGELPSDFMMSLSWLASLPSSIRTRPSPSQSRSSAAQMIPSHGPKLQPKAKTPMIWNIRHHSFA